MYTVPVAVSTFQSSNNIVALLLTTKYIYKRVKKKERKKYLFPIENDTSKNCQKSMAKLRKYLNEGEIMHLCNMNLSFYQLRLHYIKIHSVSVNVIIKNFIISPDYI